MSAARVYGSLLLWALVGASATAQSGPELFERWVIAVRDHRAGEADDWAVAIGDWTKDQLVATLNEVQRGRTPDLAVRAGAVLHFDIAVRGAPRARGPLLKAYPPGGPRPPDATTFLVLDGREGGRGASATHLEFARALLQKLTRSAANEEFVRLWYTATAAQLAGLLNHAELLIHLDHARRTLPDDPEVLLASGCLHETFAAPRSQAVLRATAGSATVLTFGSERANLSEAERYYRRALSALPGFAEARLRLGRVLGLQGKHREAVVELQRAVDAAGEAIQSYYALLFLGREEEMLGRLASAQASFERAATLYPSAQAPQMSLSRLALERGDEAGARTALNRAVVAHGEVADALDPWWLYHACEGRHADPKLARMYQAIAQVR